MDFFNLKMELFKTLGFIASLPVVYLGVASAKEGHYKIGVGIGEQVFSTRFLSDPTLDDMRDTIANRVNRMGATGNLFFSYQTPFSPGLALGTELGLQANGARNLTSSQIAILDYDQGNIDAYKTLSSAVSVNQKGVTPYFDFTPIFPIGHDLRLITRLGISYNTITVSDVIHYSGTGTSTAPNTDVSTESSTSQSRQATRIGVRTGIGIEYPLTPKLDVVSSVVLTQMSSVSSNQSGTLTQVSCDSFDGCSVNANGTYTGSTKAKIINEEAMLELLYHLS